MSLLEDASLLSFYFILQSSQKIPSQEGMEDHQKIMSHTQKQTGMRLGSQFTPDNSDQVNLKAQFGKRSQEPGARSRFF